MKQSELNSLIRECIREIINELTPEEWRKKSEELAKKKPQRPVLSPAEEAEVIRQFKALPIAKKKEYSWCLKRSCSYCEHEFKVSNVGSSHGICPRHQAEVYAQMGKKVPPSHGERGCFDLAKFSPEERVFAMKLFAVLDKRYTDKYGKGY